MMQKLVYPGPTEAVVGDPIVGGRAERGVPVEIYPEHVKSLLEQGWTRPGKPKARKASARKAAPAAKEAAEQPESPEGEEVVNP